MKGFNMKAINFILILMCSAMFFAVFGAFFDVITANEAVLVLAVFGIPLTALRKLTTN
jgi:hypothetical protein